MEKEIKNQLKTLEEERQIKILLAVESGSRAWGFPSPDSDYDVRIIYCKTKDWYFSINERKDSIEYFHGALLDINGWDIRKTLRLLNKSNATPFEWAQSPIVYQEEQGFKEQLLALAKNYFQPYHSLNHYKGILQNSYKFDPQVKQIKLKKLFYVIRPLLAAKWIVQYQSIPPMAMDGLLPMVIKDSIKAKILQLITHKSTANESYQYILEEDIMTYIDQEIAILQEATLEKKKMLDLEPLNEFFRATVNQYT